MSEPNPRYLRIALMIANRSREHGNPPFGAVLVSDRGRVFLEAEDTEVATHDCTGHAETNLVREASRRFPRRLLSRCTLYVNAEPCPMCAGAIFWSGVGRVVFGLSSPRLHKLTPDQPEHLFERCAEVLTRGTRRVEVFGPMIEEEAEEVFKESFGSAKTAGH